MDRNVNVIEITNICNVALRKESVDRNGTKSLPYGLETRRSPQGERG